MILEKYALYAKKHILKMLKTIIFKVRDHCHYTGKYRGAAHKICNLMYNTPNTSYFS